MKNQPLYIKYRPQTFDELVGQDKAIKRLQVILRNGAGGRAFWISGKSGTGKTTLAFIIANQLSDNVVELDASELSAARVRELEANSRYSSMFGGHCYVINEAHGIRKDAARQFLVWLERLNSETLVVFTTTKEQEDKLFEDDLDAPPLISRCQKIELTSQGISKAFAQRAQEIASAENMDGQPIAAYEKLAYKHKCNFRAMLQDIEAGVMMEE